MSSTFYKVYIKLFYFAATSSCDLPCFSGGEPISQCWPSAPLLPLGEQGQLQRGAAPLCHCCRTTEEAAGGRRSEVQVETVPLHHSSNKHLSLDTVTVSPFFKHGLKDITIFFLPFIDLAPMMLPCLFCQRTASATAYVDFSKAPYQQKQALTVLCFGECTYTSW